MGDFDTVLSRGVKQYLVRQSLPPLSSAFTEYQVKDMTVRQSSSPFNALTALSVMVSPDRRSEGLAEMVIESMKETGFKEKLQTLVFPLRPTRKADFPRVSMKVHIMDETVHA